MAHTPPGQWARSTATSFVRAVQLDDIRIRSGGSGRLVEAYAAVFDTPAEIVDADGHYLEVNDPGAFNRTIAHRSGRGFPVVYHHGMTLAGGASDRGSVPIGVSKEVEADKRGVRTLWEAARTPLADEVLEAIRQGSITGQSYGGRFLRSNPGRRPVGGYRPDGSGALRTVRRLEVAMNEFGPTPFPAFVEAAVVGLRSAQLFGRLMAATPDQLRTLLNQLDDEDQNPNDPDTDDTATPQPADPADPGTSTTEPAGTPPESTDSPTRRTHLAAKIRAAMIARGLETEHGHRSPHRR